eukprot:9259639-Pyramimonas_sp.AAC.1
MGFGVACAAAPHPSPWFLESQRLRRAALREADQFPCFWVRGLIQASWLNLPPAPSPTGLQGRRRPGTLFLGSLP